MKPDGGMRNDRHVVSRKNYIKPVISEKSSLRLLCSESVAAEQTKLNERICDCSAADTAASTAIRGIRVNRGWLFSGQQSVVDSDCH